MFSVQNPQNPKKKKQIIAWPIDLTNSLAVEVQDHNQLNNQFKHTTKYKKEYTKSISTDQA